MEIKDLVKFKQELENICGKVNDIHIDTDDEFIIIYVEYGITLTILSKLKEHFGVNELYIGYYKGGVTIRVQ